MAKSKKPAAPVPSVTEDAGYQGQKGNTVAHLGEQEEELEQRRHTLAANLARKGYRTKGKIKPKARSASNNAGQAIKLSSEFLAAVVVGVVLGLGFDKILGLSPWGLIFFLFMGFAAGVLNVLRAAGHVPPSQVGQQNVKRLDETSASNNNKGDDTSQ